ncbi:MAG: hypothetical protein ACTS6A_02910 [Candidatus Hodgkinia cicadicola]
MHLETRRMAPFRRSIERLVVLGSGLAWLMAATWAESSFHLEPLVNHWSTIRRSFAQQFAN